MTEPIPIFLNDQPLRVRAGSTLGEVLSEHAPDLLRGLLDGSAIATDGRAVPVDPDAPVMAGAIFRVRRSARGGPGA